MLNLPAKLPEANSLDQKLSELQQKYSQALPAKFQQIRDLWRKLIHYSWNDEAFSLLQRIVHSLAGSGKTFGFEQLSTNAKKLDVYLIQFLNNNSRPSAIERKHIDALIKVLENSTQQQNSNNKPQLADVQNEACSINSKDNTIFIVDDDPHVSQYIGTILSNVGYHTRSFTNPKHAIDYVKNCPPDLVIMDVMFPEGNLAGIDVIEDLRATVGKRVPVLFISSRTDLNARVYALRSGGDAYLTKPIEVQHLVGKIDELISSLEKEKHRVLIVDDDKELSAYYALVLRKAGMNTLLINQPVKVLETLETFKPDLILMDMYMPDYNGLELASVLRQDDKYIGLPIIFVSSEGSKEIHEQAFNLGVDDFVVKPVVGDKLVETVKRQVKRARKVNKLVSKLSKFDSKTSLANRQFFLEQLEFALASTTEENKNVLIDITVDNVKAIISNTGLEWMEDLNQQIANIVLSHIRKGDLATQFSENVYMVLTHNHDSQSPIDLVKSLRDVLSSSIIRLGNQVAHISCNIGVIELNENIHTMHELLSHAVQLSEKAGKKGLNQYVVSSPAAPDQSADNTRNEEYILNAIEKNEYKLAFQPVINLTNGSDEKYEVLVRLKDENGKLFLPHQFFPIVNSKGYIKQLDRWVIENAISALSNNSHARSASDLIVKVSLSTLTDKMLLPRISNSLTSSGIPGENRIIFEINENDLLVDTVSVTEFSERIKKINCGISISNYGRSNSYLKVFEMLPVNYVKLYGDTLNNILIDESQQKRVKEVIDHALANGAQVIAGTIEDPATLSLLFDFGARYFQGFFIQEPDFDLDYNFSVSVAH